MKIILNDEQENSFLQLQKESTELQVQAGLEPESSILMISYDFYSAHWQAEVKQGQAVTDLGAVQVLFSK